MPPKIASVGLPLRLGVCSPPVNQPTNNQPADTAKDKNRNILVRNDGVRQADKQTEQEADKPARPSWQLNAPDDKPNGEAAYECAE
jgi:hypothetical protein